MTEIVERGNTVRTRLTVRDDLGEKVDPAVLALTVVDSSGTSSTYIYPVAQIIRESAGEFRSDITVVAIGIWEYTWITTNPDRTAGAEIYVIADQVSSAPLMSSVADYARMYLGGQTWKLLIESEGFGATYVTLAIETVKRRTMSSPPTTPLEHTLNPLVLDYLGILTALQLMPAAKDAWGSKIISRSVGNDPAEITTFTDRSKLIDGIQSDLLRRLGAIQALALEHVVDPVTGPRSQMATDEIYDRHVTHDPRSFPPASTFPYPDDPYVVDPWTRYPYLPR